MCNALVCLAIWLTYGAHSVTDKVLAILFPITAFVAAGFEHSVANMYFLPMGLLIHDEAPSEFWQADLRPHPLLSDDHGPGIRFGHAG